MLVEAAAALSSHCRTAFPSGVSMSADGQLSILTHTHIHILTPSLGLSLRTDRSALPGYPGNKAQDQWTADKLSDHFEDGECQGLPLFKNGIEIRKREIEWEDWTNDVRNTVPGGLDNGWRMTSWSPSGLNQLGGCILAAMNVNREVHIYAPGHDPIKATWVETYDLSTMYLNMLLDADPELATFDTKQLALTSAQIRKKEALVQKVQATSMAWSPATPAHAVKDESLLAISHRSGHLTLWRYGSEGDMSLLATELPIASGATVIAWTDWISHLDPASSQVTYTTQLALGVSSGSICIIQITIQSDSHLTIEPIHAVLDSHKAVTALRWLKTGQLAVGRLGEVILWTPSQILLFSLPIENFRGWPSVPTPVDLIHVSASDRLVVALSDGTFRVISALSSIAQLEVLHESKSSSSLQLSEQMRRGFLAVERAAAKKGATVSGNTAMLLSGCIGLNGSGTFVSAYERHNLDVKVFGMANLHKSAITLGRLFSDSDDVGMSILEDMRMLLVATEPGLTTSTSRALFPILLSLRHLRDAPNLPTQLLNTLSRHLDLNYQPPSWLVSEDDYSTFLLGDRRLQAIRLGAQIVKHCLHHIALGNLYDEFENLLQVLVRHLYALTFSAMSRILEFKGTMNNTLYHRLQHVMKSIQAPELNASEMNIDGASTKMSAEVFDTEIDDLDRCAACSEVIGFDRLGRATCRNGHEWLRCSITLAVLSTAAARTCTVCSRKSRVPAALNYQVDELETASQTLLHIAKYCLFCGGRWTRGH